MYGLTPAPLVYILLRGYETSRPLGVYPAERYEIGGGAAVRRTIGQSRGEKPAPWPPQARLL